MTPEQNRLTNTDSPPRPRLTPVVRRKALEVREDEQGDDLITMVVWALLFALSAFVVIVAETSRHS